MEKSFEQISQNLPRASSIRVSAIANILDFATFYSQEGGIIAGLIGNGYSQKVRAERGRERAIGGIRCSERNTRGDEEEVILPSGEKGKSVCCDLRDSRGQTGLDHARMNETGKKARFICAHLNSCTQSLEALGKANGGS